MRIFGQLIKARLQNIASAVAASAKGLVYYRTDEDKVYVDDSATLLEAQLRRDLVGNFRTDGPTTVNKAQLALCNNVANNGYEYNNGVIKLTKAAINALTRTAGFTYYATDENLYYGDNGVSLISLGGSTPTFTVFSTAVDYAITDGDGYSTILVTDTTITRNVTLPAAANNTNRKILIQNTSTQKGLVNVLGGAFTVKLDYKDAFVEFQSNGSSWFIVNTNLGTPVMTYDAGTITPITGSPVKSYLHYYPLLTIDGTWKLQCKFRFTSAVANFIQLTLDAVTVWTGGNQSVSGFAQGNQPCNGYVATTSNDLFFYSGSNTTVWLGEFEIRLQNKPTFVP